MTWMVYGIGLVGSAILAGLVCLLICLGIGALREWAGCRSVFREADYSGTHNDSERG